MSENQPDMKSEQPEIQHEDQPERGRFSIGQAAQLLAEMTYSRSNASLVIIDHTFVDPSQRGKGLGQDLLEALVSWARAEQIKVMPLCPFAKAQFDKHEAYRDVLAAGA